MQLRTILPAASTCLFFLCWPLTCDTLQGPQPQSQAVPKAEQCFQGQRVGMRCRRLVLYAQVLPGGGTRPLWFCLGCDIHWENNLCLLEQLQSGLHSCADKVPTKSLSSPSTLHLSRMPSTRRSWEKTSPPPRPRPQPLGPAASVACPAAGMLSPSARRSGVVSTGSRGM